ncbi:hypothetical protein JB92DRAFT_1948915 [Gautieria morchelliformis]|nr:hypothetical protein JB92DRAFT_1948915 [Gautieria morchelliformis]
MWGPDDVGGRAACAQGGYAKTCTSVGGLLEARFSATGAEGGAPFSEAVLVFALRLVPVPMPAGPGEAVPACGFASCSSSAVSQMRREKKIKQRAPSRPWGRTARSPPRSRSPSPSPAPSPPSPAHATTAPPSAPSRSQRSPTRSYARARSRSRSAHAQAGRDADSDRDCRRASHPPSRRPSRSPPLALPCQGSMLLQRRAHPPLRPRHVHACARWPVRRGTRRRLGRAAGERSCRARAPCPGPGLFRRRSSRLLWMRGQRRGDGGEVRGGGRCGRGAGSGGVGGGIPVAVGGGVWEWGLWGGVSVCRRKGDDA